MLQLRRENKLVKDDAGYVMGCIASIGESSKVKNSLDLVFKVAGTQSEITMHLFPTQVVSNRIDPDTGKRNLMSQLCLNLGILTQDELAQDKFDSEKLNQDFIALQGRLVRFKTKKQDDVKKGEKKGEKKGDKKAVNLELIDVDTLQLVD